MVAVHYVYSTNIMGTYYMPGTVQGIGVPKRNKELRASKQTHRENVALKIWCVQGSIGEQKGSVLAT